MARPRDPAVQEVKRIRERLSRELMAAKRKGKLRETMRKLSREAHQAMRDAEVRARARRRAQA